MKKPTPAQTVVVQVPLESLVPYARNARTHDDAQVAQIAASIREFGWTNPVLIDGEKGIIAGHGRVLAARKLGLESVPCIELAHLTDTQKRAYILADNRLALNAGWDDALLALEVADLDASGFDLDLLGFDQSELDGLLDASIGDDGATEGDTEPEIDRAEELRQKWGVEPGQLWRLGEHLLLCGDASQNPEFGAGCETLVFDPPWDAISKHAISPRASVIAFCDGQRQTDVVRLFGAPTWVFAWDCVSSWYTPNRPLRRMKLALWYGSIDLYDFNGAHYGVAGEQREVFNSRGSYTFTPDPRGKHLSDVFVSPITRLHAESEHSHSKPIEWVSMLIANCTRGDVFDPFCGSGTTLIACENLKRKCRAIEISPAYVAVALDRWRSHTGRQPELSP